MISVLIFFLIHISLSQDIQHATLFKAFFNLRASWHTSSHWPTAAHWASWWSSLLPTPWSWLMTLFHWNCGDRILQVLLLHALPLGIHWSSFTKFPNQLTSLLSTFSSLSKVSNTSAEMQEGETLMHQTLWVLKHKKISFSLISTWVIQFNKYFTVNILLGNSLSFYKGFIFKSTISFLFYANSSGNIILNNILLCKIKWGSVFELNQKLLTKH